MSKNFILEVFIVLLTIFFLFGCASVPRHAPQRIPTWIDKTVYFEGDYVYSVGKSSPQDNEKSAKDEAYADALNSFVKFCKTDVSVLDRIYEAYSQKGKQSEEIAEIESSKQVFARAFVKNVEKQDFYIETKKGKYIASILIRVPRSEYERIQNERDIKLSVDIGFYYEEEGKLKPFYEGDVLKSGTGYTLYVNPSDTCYIYVFQVDESGNSFRLFPNKDYHTSNNPVMSGKQTWIPNENEVFYLDETTGRETFYIMASRDKITELEGENAINLPLSKIKQIAEIKRMGPAGVKRKVANTIVETEKRGVAELKNKLQAQSDFWYEMMFYHK